jgi:uncharacterized membrane protein
LRRPELSPAAVDLLSSGLFAVVFAAIAVIALSAPRRPRLAQLAFLLVAAFILTNKAYSPQFVLWLIPLFALARPRWRDFLVWQGIEGLHWAAVWMYLGQVTSAGSSQHNLDMPYYVLAVAAHMVAVAYLMARVTRDIYDPNYDPVRRHHFDDPHGGPFSGAPDWLRLNLRRPADSLLPRKDPSNA